MATKDLRINNEIRTAKVRLIQEDGGQAGVIDTRQALEMAEEAGLDLVEVSPNAEPPVCRIFSYGKYKFEQDKKQRDSKKKQKQIKLKEVRMQPKIDTHDLQVKSRQAQKFMDEGNKVKITIRFRGRELAHTELGLVVMDKITENLGEEYTVEKAPVMEGRFMSMIMNRRK